MNQEHKSRRYGQINSTIAEKTKIKVVPGFPREEKIVTSRREVFFKVE